MTKHSFSNGLLAKDKAGTALLVPNLPSDMRVLEASDRQCCLSDGASLASTSGVGIKMKRA